jgi:predicted nucleic acid-binding Zn ribbon protein
MQPLRTASTRALQSLLHDQPVTAAKVVFAWQIAAGPAMARATSPAWSDDGVLRVRARDTAWRREVARARPMIAQRLEQLLGSDVVKKIVIETDA